MGTKDMNAGRPTVFQRLLFICVALVLVPASLYGSLAIKARFSDGPSVIFSGGLLIAGEMVTGPEPDWSFVRDVREFELQLLNPANSRTLWIVEVENKLYLNSNYMGGLRQRLWKRWPLYNAHRWQTLRTQLGANQGRADCRSCNSGIYRKVSSGNDTNGS